MTTYHEIEEIKKSHVQEMVRVQNRVLATLVPPAPDVDRAVLLASPFGKSGDQGIMPHKGSDSYQKMGTQITVPPETVASSGEAGLLATVIVSVAGLLFLGVMLRRMLE